MSVRCLVCTAHAWEGLKMSAKWCGWKFSDLLVTTSVLQQLFSWRWHSQHCASRIRGSWFFTYTEEPNTAQAMKLRRSLLYECESFGVLFKQRRENWRERRWRFSLNPLLILSPFLETHDNFVKCIVCILTAFTWYVDQSNFDRDMCFKTFLLRLLQISW